MRSFWRNLSSGLSAIAASIRLSSTGAESDASPTRALPLFICERIPLAAAP
jgi:hypothetical protein